MEKVINLKGGKKMVNQICDSPIVKKNDCFVRAFNKFTTMPYEKAYNLIKPFQSFKGGITKSKVQAFLETQCLQWINANGTTKKFIEEHNKGRLMVFVNNHVMPVVNGNIHDSDLNNLNKRVTGYVVASMDR